ncbi:hypothetical protein G9A89_018585 [Geosiphon pyriformis]|nr:hypothetical protein G9A89_018585 [Geosiphon pyriformis]
MILVTYGSPRIGISHLNNWILSAFECARITIGNDHVPLFFGPKYLRHFQLEVWITSNNGCDCFDPEGKEIPDIYICFQLFSRSENKECNLKFEKPKGELPENAMDVHLGPYFGYLMSPQGCKD